MSRSWQTLTDRVSRVAQSVPPVFLGSAFARTWVRSTTPLLPPEAVLGNLTPGNLFDVSGALIALILALLSGRLDVPERREHMAGAAALAMAMSSVFVALADATGATWLAGVAAAVGGCGFMALSLAWCAFYMTFNPMRMVLLVCTSQLASDVLIFAVEGYNPPQLHCLLSLLPALAWWSYRRALHSLRADDAASPATGGRPIPWKPALFLGVYAFAYSIAESASGVLNTYPGLFLYLLPPALFVVGVVFQPRHLTLRGIYLVACPLMLLALLLPVACPELPGGVSAAFITMGYDISKILGTLILGSLAYRLGVSGLWMMGLARAVSYTGLFLGSWCYRAFEQAGGGLSITLCAMLALCVAIVSLVVFTEEGLDGNWAMTSRPIHGDEDPEAGSPSQAIARARELYGLTAREEEVCYLLARKKTVPAIAADMFLAQGTVKAHVQHIYQKMGVHSRAELEERLGVRE